MVIVENFVIIEKMINSSKDNFSLYNSVKDGSDKDKLKKIKLKKLKDLKFRFP